MKHYFAWITWITWRLQNFLHSHYWTHCSISLVSLSFFLYLSCWRKSISQTKLIAVIFIIILTTIIRPSAQCPMMPSFNHRSVWSFRVCREPLKVFEKHWKIVGNTFDELCWRNRHFWGLLSKLWSIFLICESVFEIKRGDIELFVQNFHTIYFFQGLPKVIFYGNLV